MAREPEDEQVAVDGPYRDGAALVRGVLGTLTSRAVEGKVKALGYKLSHTTVSNMRRGKATDPGSLLALAATFPRFDKAALFKGFGHNALSAAVFGEALPVERYASPSEREMLRFFRGLPPEGQERVLGYAEAQVTKGRRTAADIVREQERARTIGTRADEDENPTYGRGGDDDAG